MTRLQDLRFNPVPQRESHPETLGLLARLAATPSLFEPFRNPATADDICNCLLRLLEVRSEFQRQANRDKMRINETDYPMLWILTPTASPAILQGLHAILDERNWLDGIYFLPEKLRCAIVVIHLLPATPNLVAANSGKRESPGNGH